MAPYTRSMHRRSQIRDWALLQMEILDLILQRLLHPDCLNFSKVCRNWRSVYVDRREFSQPPPCILLRSTEGEIIQHEAIIHLESNLHRGIFHGGQLLRLFSSRLNSFDRIVGSCFGWLVIARRFISFMYLLNPASNERIPLPSLELYSVLHVDLSSRPTNGTCVLIGRVLYEDSQIQRLVRCRPGDHQWTVGIFEPQDHLQQCVDSVFHKGKLYLLCNNGDIVFKRLVKSNGQLLLVVHQTIDDQLLVFRNGEELGDRWVRVDNLVDQVLLIGIHGAESICTKDLMGSTYEPNYIYYCTLRQYVKKYSMIDGRMENIHVVEQPLEWVVTKEW